MKYDIRKVVFYAVLDKNGNIVNEFADYDDAYRWVQEADE